MRNKDDTADLQTESFVVDAALVRELGETLIGKAHIALGELVKNSFDADAHDCEIRIEQDSVVVSDNGHGISEEEFKNYWLRLGTTHKVEKRQSRTLKRSMTGSKGLGRLSVQFLAAEMELESNCPHDPQSMLYVFVDWTGIRSGNDLQTVDVGWEIRKEPSIYADGSPTGTNIALKGLRTSWDEKAIEELGGDVWMLRSPFGDSRKKTSRKTALDFHIDIDAPEIADAKERFNKLYNIVFDNWKARITGVLQNARRGRKESTAGFTIEFAVDYPKGVEEARSFKETVSFPIVRQSDVEDEEVDPEEERMGVDERDTEEEMTERADLPALDKAKFTILVFKPEGKQPGGLTVREVRTYLRTYGDVSVYDAGFRLPYYGSEELSGHDWLSLGADQGRRLVTSELLPDRLRIDGRYLLDLPNPGRIFGAVDVDTNHEQKIASRIAEQHEWLQIQPGRDRLVPNTSFTQLRNFVRFGLDLYANRYRALADDVAQEDHTKNPPAKVLDTAVATLTESKSAIPLDVYRDIRKDLLAARRAAANESQVIETQAALLAPLATAGMAALAMNHELTNDAELLEDISRLLDELSQTNSSPLLKSAIGSLKLYRSHVKAYGVLFAPLTTPDDRQAMSRLPVKTVVRQVVDALRPRLTGVSFDLNHIPPKLLFPVGSFVEWSALLQNLLFNAWNAMLDSDIKELRFDGSSSNAKRQFLRTSDTGVGLTMPLTDSRLLFEAFEREMQISAANRSIAIGGQGLGLAIVRMIARSRDADVAFVEPRSDFSTAIELSW